jgi:hypothetical protein
LSDSVDREAIWAAYFAHMKAALADQFKTIGRRHVQPPALLQNQQPALFVCQITESKESKPRGSTGKLTLHGFNFIYVYQSATNEVPGKESKVAATDLNALMKAVDDAMMADGDGVFTIGGLVSHCWIEGTSLADQGVWGQQAMAMMPVHILVP